jgi:hypothetical protein
MMSDDMPTGEIKMRTKRFWLLLAVVTVFVLGGFFDAQANATKKERESYRKQVEEKLKAMGKQIGKLKEKATEIKAEARAEYKGEMKDLRDREKAAKRKLKELKKGRANTWDKAKSEMEAAVDSLEKAFDRVAERFRKQ